MNNLYLCRQYNQGFADRRAYPLHAGLYKLRESEMHSDRVLSNLAELMECRSLRQPLISIGAGNQAAVYLKRIPLWLAYRLSYDFLASVEALVGDGIPIAVVATHLPAYKQRARSLVDDLQLAHDELRSRGVREEYRQWDDGESVLLNPCARFKEMVQDALSLEMYKVTPLPCAKWAIG
jgi:hypothetical protein